MKVLKNTIVFMLLLQCVVLLGGCAEERLSVSMATLLVPTERAIGPVPLELQEILWYENAEARAKYYTKYIAAGGVVILGTDAIEDRYFYAAREIVLEMTSKRPEIREILTPTHEPRDNPSSRFRMILITPGQDLSGMPKRDLSSYKLSGWSMPAGWCDGGQTHCVSSVSKFLYRGKYELSMSTFVHEFAHAMHFAIRNLDPTFDDRLKAAYQAVMDDPESYWWAGEWRDSLLDNPREYWAGSVTEWFYDLSFRFSNPQGFGRYATKDFLKKDHLMYALMQEWLDFKNLHYINTKIYE